MTEPTLPPYGVGDLPGDSRREAPAAARNLGPIAAVLADWLPATGTVLEIASGTGEHALAFANRFPDLMWQPSDHEVPALASIAAWQGDGPANLLPPVHIDATQSDWPIRRADILLCINMVHISPWECSVGLLAGASRVLSQDGQMILYGPWLERGVDPAPSNLTFHQWLKDRDPRFGLREVEAFAALASTYGLVLIERRAMPANNLMLRFRRDA